MILEEGDILISKRSGPISKLIKILTNSDYSHAALYIGNNCFVESDWGGVHVSHISKYYDTPYDIYKPKKITHEQQKIVTEWSKGQIGKGYDLLGILGIAVTITGLTKTNLFDNKRRFWCSELVQDAYMNAGINLVDDKNSVLVSPGDLAKSDLLYKVNLYDTNKKI